MVGLVAQLEIGRECVRADVGPLGLAASRADRRIGDEVDLHLGLRRHDRADVAALDHDVALGAELALALPHHLAHLVVAGDDRDVLVDPHLPDRVGDVGAVDVDAPAGVEDDRVLLARGSPSAAPSPRSRPRRSASQVRLRYIAPVSR